VIPELQQPDRRRNLLLMALLVIGTIIVYFPALTANFIWDDDVHFTANEAVRRWRGLVDIWTSRAAVYYPLVLTTGWTLHKMVGFDPLVFHAVTLGLHMANALLLVLLLKRFAIPGAWVAGFLFAWHPMQVESVAWVTELKNTQSAFLLFLSLLFLQASGFFTRAEPGDARQKRWLTLSIGFYALALLSKPSVVMIPVALVALVWWRRGLRRWMDIDALFPYFMLALLASGWTVWEQRYSSGAQGFEWTLNLIERLVLSGQIFWFYVRQVIVPHPIMFLYPQWSVDPGALMSWLPLIGALTAGGICIWKSRSWGLYPGLVLFWFAVLLFPVMGFFNVYFMRYAWVADHFVYLPIISFCVAVGAGWAWLARFQRHLAWAVAVAGLAACGWASHQHARTFHDLPSLWRASLEANPGAWMAHNNLGLIYAGQGDLDQAEHHYAAALEHNPRHYEALHNIGLLRLTETNATLALPYFDQALALRPELFVASLNRGKALEILGRYEEAFAAYEHALELHPPLEAAYVSIARLAEKEEQPDKAVEAYERLFYRKNASAQQLGGFLFERAYHVNQEGDPVTALALLVAARQRAGEIPDIHLLEGAIHEEIGDFDQAEKSYRIALSLRPNWGAVLVRLARILAAHPDVEKRRPQEAVAMTENMVKSGGRDVPEIIETHAMALASVGRYGEAIRAQSRAIQLAGAAEGSDSMNRRLRLYERGETYTLEAKSAGSDNPEP